MEVPTVLTNKNNIRSLKKYKGKSINKQIIIKDLQKLTKDEKTKVLMFGDINLPYDEYL